MEPPDSAIDARSPAGVLEQHALDARGRLVGERRHVLHHDDPRLASSRRPRERPLEGAVAALDLELARQQPRAVGVGQGERCGRADGPVGLGHA